MGRARRCARPRGRRGHKAAQKRLARAHESAAGVAGDGAGVFGTKALAPPPLLGRERSPAAAGVVVVLLLLMVMGLTDTRGGGCCEFSLSPPLFGSSEMEGEEAFASRAGGVAVLSRSSGSRSGVPPGAHLFAAALNWARLRSSDMTFFGV